jgi:hypothetical protein
MFSREHRSAEANHPWLTEGSTVHAADLVRGSGTISDRSMAALMQRRIATRALSVCEIGSIAARSFNALHGGSRFILIGIVRMQANRARAAMQGWRKQREA